MKEKKKLKKRHWVLIVLAAMVIISIIMPSKDDTEQAAVKVDPIAENVVREIIEYQGLGEGDSLTKLEVDDYEIKAVVKVGKHDLLTEAMKAAAVSIAISDALLKEEGWDTLTVEFTDVGTVIMSRKDAKENEFGGKYFPLEEIMKQLGHP